MSSYYLAPIAGNSQIDTAGNPLSGGFIYTYLPGTTTNVATYTDNTGGTQQTNPIVLNTYGLPPSPVWLLGGQAVKFVIKDSLGNTIRTIDNISGIDDPSAVTGRLLNVQVVTASTTYVPTAGTNSIYLKMQAPGGGSGGCVAVTAGQWASGRPGGGGGYGEKRITSGFSGAAIVIGAPGTAGTAGDNPGGTGGTTSFGVTMLSCTGGTGGGGSGAALSSGPAVTAGSTAAGGAATGADLSIPGSAPMSTPFAISTSVVVCPAGGFAHFGPGGSAKLIVSNNGSGATPGGFGGGASAPAQANGAFAAAAGAPGAPGVLEIWEYA